MQFSSLSDKSYLIVYKITKQNFLQATYFWKYRMRIMKIRFLTIIFKRKVVKLNG